MNRMDPGIRERIQALDKKYGTRHRVPARSLQKGPSDLEKSDHREYSFPGLSGNLFFGCLFPILIIALFNSCNSTDGASSDPEKASDSNSVAQKELQEVDKEYGMITDSFQVVKGTVRPGDFLAKILQEHGVSYRTIDRLVKEADTTFDVGRIRAGKDYTVFCEKDSSGKAQCFVYQPDPVNYVVFDMRDSLTVRKGKKEVETKERTASGTIEHSLFMALNKKSISPLIALELSEIYAWSIDFYRVDKGDRFRVLFEEHFVDGRSVGIGDIEAAEFVHRDSSYYAFHFEQDSAGDYFDQTGNSLKKAFLKAPLRFSRISSHFSHNRFHPVLKQYRPHRGVDYAAPRGTPVHTVGNGRVVSSGYSSGNGHYVKVRHNSVYTSMYLHLSSRAVSRGEQVAQGERIGRVGSTGLSTGPHLDYRIYKNGSAVNPLTLDIPPGEPVDSTHRELFEKRKKELMKSLKEIPFDKEASQGV
jgi:murein DD-endopeptidase MepM/ murein hydrolase activator NlpD